MEKRISELYPDIKDCYTINDSGEIRNTNTGNYISKKKEADGYIRVSLMKKSGGTRYVQFHRLLMMAFRPVEGMEKLQVNHIDGNKQNNNFENLEWCIAQENLNHAIRTGLKRFDYLYGEKTNFSHYTEKDALKVIELLKTNQYTDKEISNITGYPARSFITKIRCRETWRYLTDNIKEPLGKLERHSANQTLNDYPEKEQTQVSRNGKP